MKIVRNITLVSVLALTPSIAMAQEMGRIYMEGRGGVTFLTDADNTGGGINIKSSHDVGPNVAAAVGYSDPSGFRGELELSYRENEIDDLTIRDDGGIGVALGVGSLNGFGFSASGDVSIFTAMGNLYYDFPTTGPWKPFVGGGIGVAEVSVDASALGVEIVDDSDTVVAYQVGAGIAYELTPLWSFTVAYRYLATTDPRLTDAVGESFDSEYSSHNVMGGIRFTF